MTIEALKQNEKHSDVRLDLHDLKKGIINTPNESLLEKIEDLSWRDAFSDDELKNLIDYINKYTENTLWKGGLNI